MSRVEAAISRRRVLLGRDCLAVSVGACDAGVLLDRRLVWHREVLDVVARAGDLLDLEAVDHETERLHLLAATIAHLLGELVLVADHLFDGHRTGDRTQVADEDVLNLRLQLHRGPIEEAPCRIRNGRIVVANLVDNDAAQIKSNLLLTDARHGHLALVRLERKGPDLGHARENEHAAAGDDSEALAAAVSCTAAAHARDDQRLIGLGDPPAHAEYQDKYRDDRDDRDQGNQRNVKHLRQPQGIGRLDLNGSSAQGADDDDLGVLTDRGGGIRCSREKALRALANFDQNFA